MAGAAGAAGALDNLATAACAAAADPSAPARGTKRKRETLVFWERHLASQNAHDAAVYDRVVHAVDACAVELSRIADLLEKRRALVADARERTRVRSHLFKSEVAPPESSPWVQLFARGSEADFIYCCGVSKRVFTELYDAFQKEYIIRSGTGRNGRPVVLQGRAVLALVLQFVMCDLKQKLLCLVFGATEGVLSRALEAGMDALLRVLQRMDDAAITFPTDPDQLQHYADMLSEQDSTLCHVVGLVSGYAIGSNHVAAEDANVLLWTPDNLVAWASVGESLSDGTVLNSLFRKLNEHLQPSGSYVMGERPFRATGEFGGLVQTPMTAKELATADPNLQGVFKLTSDAIERLCQSPSWGKLAIARVFLRLTCRLSPDPAKRNKLLKICVHLWNLRKRRLTPEQLNEAQARIDARENPLSVYNLPLQ
eukprot:m.62014 g.62014  ORF g.62014 m.62014 type:complete len:426 (-) comp7380_c0_seq1:58-1335(-)